MRSFDMHVHTCYSHDSNTPLTEIQKICKQKNIGVAITDHNEIAGNIAAHKLGIPTIPAIEVTSKNIKDILCYFSTLNDLQEFYEKTIKPAKRSGKLWKSKTTLTERQILTACHKHNGYAVLAHPYAYLNKNASHLPKTLLQSFDGIEVMNFTLSNHRNQLAYELAETYRKIHTGGSDSHHISTLGNVIVLADAHNSADFLEEVMNGHGIVIGKKRHPTDVIKKATHYLQTLH